MINGYMWSCSPHGIAVNNAALTGESTAVGRIADATSVGTVLEARSCVFMGTTVLTGTGKAVVFATGASTGFGRIFRLTQEESSTHTDTLPDLAR